MTRDQMAKVDRFFAMFNAEGTSLIERCHANTDRAEEARLRFLDGIGTAADLIHEVEECNAERRLLQEAYDRRDVTMEATGALVDAVAAWVLADDHCDADWWKRGCDR